ncbi:carboxypeptidase-like regulatory domain-containing protein [Thermococcus thermotolerans]|uniref:carboxypeptidase-like regulatory domain-containing protein n=1 Tax=Thermococcus thermotolerans TaxID=2969672 RepID=UPI002158005E|nr:carboxypeptidase-like regulatory domain-containing protein [Thermococcus thermotolerans]
MRREHAALFLLTMVFLAALTLGYSELPYSEGGGSSTKSLLDAMLSNDSADDSRSSSGNSGGGGEISFDPGFPHSNFTFKPTDIHTDCPVAVLPDDPMLVCTDEPARSLPVLSSREPDDMVVWYPGTYYIPLVYGEGDVKMIKGVNHGPVTIDTDRPLVILTYNQSVTLEFEENASAGRLSVFTALPVKVKSVEEVAGRKVHRYLIGPAEESMKPGYYPLFVTVNSTNGTVALLMWVALLEKPVVEITDYPEVVGGDGSIWVTVTGTVRYPDGRPVEGGIVWVTLNESKGQPGIFLGQTTVEHGKFRVKGIIGPEQPPGRYHVIAYYRGYMAYPSNSDPVMVVKRKPQVSVYTENSTVKIRLHWKGVPLANETLNVSVGSKVFTLKTDSNGYVTLNLTHVETDSIKVQYGGSAYYLPINETVPLLAEKKFSGEVDDSKESLVERLSKLLRRFIGAFNSIFPLLAIIAIAGAGYGIYSKRRTEVKLSPRPKFFTEKVEFIEPSRRVFLPGEIVRVVLSTEAELSLDGRSIGFGKEFRLELEEGRHVLSAGKEEVEVYVLPPRDAVIKAYELHFLPFASSNGVPERPMTPLEIEHLLARKGFDRNILHGVTLVLIRAKYSEHRVGKDDFFALLEGLGGLGVI